MAHHSFNHGDDPVLLECLTGTLKKPSHRTSVFDLARLEYLLTKYFIKHHGVRFFGMPLELQPVRSGFHHAFREHITRAGISTLIARNALPDKTISFALKVPVDVKAKIVTERIALYDTARKVGKKEIEYQSRNSVGSTFGRDRIVHKVRSGDVLGKIGMKYHVRVSDIRKWNRLNGNLIRVGQRLNIWVLPSYDRGLRTQPVAKTVQKPVNLNGKKIHYVQSGDTLWDISRKYDGLTIDKIKKLNNLKSSSIKPGQPLVIGEAD